MNKNLKILLFSVLALFVIFSIIQLFRYHKYQKTVAQYNICQDEVLIFKLIDNNVNPFSKFKFIKKRNDDCKTLLTDNKEEAIKLQKQEFCSYLDSSTNSLTVLINAYVHEMYDRDTASKEFKLMTPLMTPYDYCPQYMNNMITLIKIKKRLGL